MFQDVDFIRVTTAYDAGPYVVLCYRFDGLCSTVVEGGKIKFFSSRDEALAYVRRFRSELVANDWV